MFEKIKQLKNLRDQAKQLKETMDQEVINAQAASGKVNITMNGSQEILDIQIDPEFLNPGKKEELEKALKEAFSEANNKIRHLMASRLQSTGFNLPGL